MRQKVPMVVKPLGGLDPRGPIRGRGLTRPRPFTVTVRTVGTITVTARTVDTQGYRMYKPEVCRSLKTMKVDHTGEWWTRDTPNVRRSLTCSVRSGSLFPVVEGTSRLQTDRKGTPTRCGTGMGVAWGATDREVVAGGGFGSRCLGVGVERLGRRGGGPPDATLTVSQYPFGFYPMSSSRVVHPLARGRRTRSEMAGE